MNNRHLRSATPRTPVAPLHRGPQAAAHAAAGLLGAPHAAPNAALLIDFDNVTMGIRSDLQTELRNLLSSDIISGKVAVQRAYADWRRYPQYIVPLSESSIDLIFAPAYGSSKKNATDIRLAVDAMELVFTRPEIGTYILLSGDSDFSSLVLKLKEYGKYVIGVGIRESSSDLLVQNCDEYYSYNALAGLVKTSEETTQKWDPWELVTEAIARMKTNSDVMRSDRLKQVMQEIDPTFDEKNLGMSKFSRFCQEASQKGLIHLTKLENGQLEVAPASGAPAADKPAAPVAAAAAPSRDDDEGPRGRRGRRGGRGRGRDRDREPRGDAPAAAAPVAAPAAAPAPAPHAHAAHKPHGDSKHGEAKHADAKHGEAKHAEAKHAEAKPAEAHKPHERRPHHAPKIDHTVGVAGMRLTRDEAFSLVGRAVEALVTGDAPVMAEAVRVKARELLGRDSESLSDRNFTRILRDTHDAGRVDVRRRGDSFEVSKVEGTVSVADQLTAAEAQAKADAPPAPAPAAAPRGVGATRGLPAKGGRAGKLPPSLLLLGVVEDTPAPAAAPTAAAPAADEAPAAKKGARGRGKPKAAAVKADTPKAEKAEKAPKAAAKAKAPAKKAKKGASA